METQPRDGWNNTLSNPTRVTKKQKRTVLFPIYLLEGGPQLGPRLGKTNEKLLPISQFKANQPVPALEFAKQAEHRTHVFADHSPLTDKFPCRPDEKTPVCRAS